VSPFDLRTSPFYLLGVSPRDDRAVIEDAVTAAIAEQEYTPTWIFNEIRRDVED
jgi:hypothetical protein